METIIELQIRNKYGRDLIYPINAQAKKFARLIQKKTFNSEDINRIKDLGFSIEFIPQSLKDIE